MSVFAPAQNQHEACARRRDVPADALVPPILVSIRAIYDDQDSSTVIVVWDGRGTTTAGTTYRNTYVWLMTLSGGKVIDGTAFYDSIAFNELWAGVAP
jgi:ketosteroid isomerase-like protein